MIDRRRTLSILGSFAALGQLGCAPMQADIVASPYQFGGMKTFFKGKSGNGAVARRVLREVLEDLHPTGASLSDRALINAIFNLIETSAGTPTSFPQLRGPGGLVYYALLKAAEAALPASGNMMIPAIKINVTGKIDEMGPDGQEGYFYNSADESGHLWVTMRHDFKTPQGDPLGMFAYDLKTMVGKSAFKVWPRTGSGNNVFPGSKIPVSTGMAKGFQHKLEGLNSRGEGLSVGALWVSNDGTNFTEWTASSNPGVYFFRSMGADACIDLMFVESPPEFLDPDATPPDYCLGRCTSPPIVNTK